MEIFHKPVLLHTVGAMLNVRAGCYYLDATFGGGGHSREIIRLGGRVLAIDQDPEAINDNPTTEVSMPALTSVVGTQLVRIRSNFSRLLEVVERYQWLPVMGIVFDLGVSLHQLTTDSRGFSYNRNGPLDMRMDPDLALTGADLINSLSKKQLAKLFSEYGDIKRFGDWLDQIVMNRPIISTSQFARLIPQSIRPQIFQAVRIAVNDELTAIKSALPQAFQVLGESGRMVIISFHSLEDRIIKDQFIAWKKSGLAKIITPKPICPDTNEIQNNPQSRSAKLRCLEKL